ncbi:hypothetical protein DFJ67_3147 [Asanoa ferruginea]|uniref:Uncharacterized protein n=1 Tax=Asanoa ferruginea TaxID=53367 RepID=A0A3D9ZTZ3_9ACTN|nr:DUF6177 family protein [Asanoa ferruginea]REF97150.1 hypothetical protein DFJ67_3147 [Asanoa ferruginea]GIF50100.1 hypothetical protein Afe04nite_46390 [Asanoa ferruginea]
MRVADTVTDRACVVLQDRPVLGLHRGLVDLLLAAERDGRAVRVVTPPTTRLTMPLHAVLAGGAGSWVVRYPEHGYFDADSGAPLHWSEGDFAAYAEPAGPAAATDAGSQLWMTVRLLHTSPPASFGLATEAVCTALTGGPPAGWGNAEPVAEPWRPIELSIAAASRGRRPTTLVVVGGGQRAAIGLLEFAIEPAGISETLTMAVGGFAAAPPDLDELATRLATDHPLGLALMVFRPGRADLTQVPFEPAEGRPLCVTVGPTAYTGDGRDALLALPGARTAGPAVHCDLSAGWAAYAQVRSVAMAGKEDGKPDAVG